MTASAKVLLIFGALSAAASVVLGAVGAHRAASAPETHTLFQTALHYHQFHAIGLLIVGVMVVIFPLNRFPASRWFVGAGGLMILGTCLFSGNLYLRSLADIHFFHALTPFGGGAFILAWLLFAYGVAVGARSAPD